MAEAASNTADTKAAATKPATAGKPSAKPVKKAKAPKAKAARSKARPAAKKTASKAKSQARKAVKTAHKAQTQAVPQAAKKVAETASGRLNSLSNAKTFNDVETIMAQTKTDFDKLAQDATQTAQAHIEALVKSGGIVAQGVENIMKTYTAWAQNSAEKNAQAVKTLLSSKSLSEFTEVQNKVARENLDDFLSQVTALSELSVKVATDSFAPLNDQMSRTVKKASKAA